MSYDPASRITGIAGSETQSYGYDALDRLTSVTAPGTTQTYSYDPNGNRLSDTLGSQTTTYNYGLASNRLQSRTQGTTQPYTYDPAGNLIADGAHTYTYDARGRMVQATTGALTTSYRHNGLGQRVSKTGPGRTAVSHRFVYDEAGHLIGEYDGAGAPIQETVYLGDLPIAVLSRTDSIHYVHADQINTPRVITNTQGAVVWRWESDPFGVGTPDQDPDGDGLSFVYDLRMSGQYYDAETGLHYNYFRDYDCDIGRYVQSDPIGLEGGLNTYTYVGGNPPNRIDPNGLEAISEMSRLDWGLGSRQNESCEACECWVTCLIDDPLLPELLGGLGTPLLNLKTPGELRPDASRWTSIDRRLPSWTGANPNAGATVTRGAIQRVKCVGRYGTIAVGVGAFTAGYTIGAARRCWVQCQE